jgi:ABC-type transport system involved in multi-copper enzyme maturation permease subunit
MDELHQREQTMQRDVLLVAAAAVSLVNGMHFSPLFDPIFFLLRPFVAPVLSSPLVLFYLTSIFISVMTLVVAGVPAALYERVRGQSQSSPVSIGIWFAATVVLALPGILGATGYFDIE